MDAKQQNDELDESVCDYDEMDDEKADTKHVEMNKMPEFQASPLPKANLKLVKIILKDTDDMLLFESNSYCVLADSEEATKVIEMNRRYDELLAKKMNKNQLEAQDEFNVETQTFEPLTKPRAINTDLIEVKEVGCVVSNYEMFDTYADLEHISESFTVTGTTKIGQITITSYSKSPQNASELKQQLMQSSAFKSPSMIMQRVLASNVFEKSQRRFRNMDKPNPLDLNIEYKFTLNLLFKFHTTETQHSAVACFNWCPANTDILAVGYGVYRFVTPERRSVGFVCLWNIKNPTSPERIYRYKEPVTAIEFSKMFPQLLAIGFYNGKIQVIDVSRGSGEDCHVAISQRETSSPMEPIWQIVWLEAKGKDDLEMLAISEDGYVMKYKMIKGPFLLGHQQLHIRRTIGKIEGVDVGATSLHTNYLNNYAQNFVLTMHPTDETIYYVGTDEGILHKCSIHYPFQSISALQVHKYRITAMEFSPFSAKIFFTCGSDWTVRIWVDGIAEPMIELKNRFEPIHFAQWCPSNSTILVAATRSRIDIYDLKTSRIMPAATHLIPIGDVKNGNKITEFRFTNCGRSIVVGDEDGATFVYALDDAPFSPHFQLEALIRVVLENLTLRTDLEKQVKEMNLN